MYGLGGSKTIFLQNRRPKLDAATIFSYLPSQLAQVCSPGFPVLGEALTYRYLTTQSNRLLMNFDVQNSKMQELGLNNTI